MTQRRRIGLVGNFNESVKAHRAIPTALQLAGSACDVQVEYEWIPTEAITTIARVSGYDGIWCIPGSPYRSMDGALRAIQFARENSKPFLGTCGGFQHAVIEYARNVLGWTDAEHAESAPDAARPVISLLACALVEETRTMQLVAGSRIAKAYKTDSTTEGYQCRFGLNPDFQQHLVTGPLRATAHDQSGEVRAIELDEHPFFVATLFQPERAALRGAHAPLVDAFVAACRR